jgi:hypothetical protein
MDQRMDMLAEFLKVIRDPRPNVPVKDCIKRGRASAVGAVAVP